MMKNEIILKLTEVFQDVFDDTNLLVNQIVDVEEIEDWDSLKHISLTLAIEKKFGFKFTINEMAKTKNINQLIDIIERNSD